MEPAQRREYGPAHFHLEKAESEILGGLPEQMKTWASHGDNVLALPMYPELAPDQQARVIQSCSAFLRQRVRKAA